MSAVLQIISSIQKEGDIFQRLSRIPFRTGIKNGSYVDIRLLDCQYPLITPLTTPNVRYGKVVGYPVYAAIVRVFRYPRLCLFFIMF